MFASTLLQSSFHNMARINYWNRSTQLYECLNFKCKRRLTEAELELAWQQGSKFLSKPGGSTGYRMIKVKGGTA
jgi:hypothetical protein